MPVVVEGGQQQGLQVGGQAQAVEQVEKGVRAAELLLAAFQFGNEGLAKRCQLVHGHLRQAGPLVHQPKYLPELPAGQRPLNGFVTPCTVGYSRRGLSFRVQGA
ncbi:hypothetical protein GCM10009863_06380 [Streptomyces axinellae]|uniref:Uncharacterized protein n=1 Tax=Streptomyces axinellae TaxID=552788 RepID=A0ABN3PTX0_9ACTN